MPDFVAVTLTDTRGWVIAHAADDMSEVRSAAEAYVRENEGAAVTIYAKGQTVQIVCAPKWS